MDDGKVSNLRRILRESYDRSAEGYDERFRGLQRPKYEALLGARGEALAGARLVLDMGCGTGLLAEWLAERGGPAPRMVGLDQSHEMLLRARRRGLSVVEGDVDRLPFRAAAFDAAVAFTSIGIDQGPRDRAIAEAARVLRPGGLFVLTVLRVTIAGDVPRELAAAGLRAGPRVECGQDIGFLCVKGRS